MILNDDITPRVKLRVHIIQDKDAFLLDLIFDSAQGMKFWMKEAESRLMKLTYDDLSFDNFKDILTETIDKSYNYLLYYQYPQYNTWTWQLYLETPTGIDLVCKVFIIYTPETYELIYPLAAKYFLETYGTIIPHYRNYGNF